MLIQRAWKKCGKFGFCIRLHFECVFDDISGTRIGFVFGKAKILHRVSTSPLRNIGIRVWFIEQIARNSVSLQSISIYIDSFDIIRIQLTLILVAFLQIFHLIS